MASLDDMLNETPQRGPNVESLLREVAYLEAQVEDMAGRAEQEKNEVYQEGEESLHKRGRALRRYRLLDQAYEGLKAARLALAEEAEAQQ